MTSDSPNLPGSVPGEPPAAKKSSKLTWVLVGCVGAVLLIFGLLAAVSIPRYFDAVKRSKQFRSMAAIRQVAEAVEAHAVKYDRYPRARSIEELRRALDSEKSTSLPTKDGWGRDLRYQDTESDYWIGSAGEDGKWEHDTLEAYGNVGATQSGASDIIYKNGVFIQWPGRAKSS